MQLNRTVAHTVRCCKEVLQHCAALHARKTDGVWLQMVLIMDEVDGMSGGDRGGVSDLIQSIHRSKVPIICICNDKYNQKLRSLRNHTLELDYRLVPCVFVIHIAAKFEAYAAQARSAGGLDVNVVCACTTYSTACMRLAGVVWRMQTQAVHVRC